MMKPNLSLLENLFDNPQSFEFYQAAKILEKYQSSSNNLRYTSVSSLGFPVNNINSISFQENFSIEVKVAFMNLIGQNGVLPSFFTELLTQQLQAKHQVLNDFLNLLNHRVIVLFFKAWEKYCANNWIREILKAIIGNKAFQLTKAEDELLYYAGLLAQKNRTASNLENILSDYFGVPMLIKQFQPSWIPLNNKNEIMLGKNSILGNYYLDFKSKFRLIIGPLLYSQFELLLPDSNRISAIKALVHRYLGCILSFDIQLIIKKSERPSLKLNQNSKLGWNTWLKVSEPEFGTSDVIFDGES